MKAIVQIWIFISAFLLVAGFLLSSVFLSLLALGAAIVVHSIYKKSNFT
ncbi:hypothetical protein [Bacillus gobiensis]